MHEGLAPAELVGCAAGGVIGARREVEEGTAVAVWAAQLDGGSAGSFHAVVEELEEGTGALAGMPELDGADGAILLADPATFPTDAVLRFLSESAPTVPVVGGLASARVAGGATALFLGEEVVDQGAVGVRLDGVELLPMRVAGRGADRARADDHRGRRPHHHRAGGQAGAREAARDDRGAARPTTSRSCRAGC